MRENLAEGGAGGKYELRIMNYELGEGFGKAEG
jgi:hypothetical protein